MTLEKQWISNGAKLGSLGAAECVDTVAGLARETEALRNSAVLWDMSFVQKFAFDEADGAEFLDGKLAGNVLKLRYGRAMETFLPDGNGFVSAATTLADIDDKIFVFAETDFPGQVCNAFAQNGADIDDTHTLLSVDGPDAWKAVKKLFGADIFNMSFMSAEKYDFRGSGAVVVRAGKTGEFGYQILVENDAAAQLFEDLKNAVLELGGALAGTRAVLAARAKGNFFNIFAEGRRTANPFELGLQWQMDMHKDAFAERFAAARAAKKRKLIAVNAAAPKVSDGIFNGAQQVGEIAAVDESDPSFALALIDEAVAYAGLVFDNSDGQPAFATVARPAILAQSLLRGMDGF